MWRRFVLAGTATGLVIVGSAAVLRAVDFRQPTIASLAPQRSGREERGLMRELNLSADQRSKIQAIRSRYRDGLKRDREASQQAQQELRALMAGNASDQQVREKFAQVKELRAKVAESQFNSLLEMRNVLTVEQRQKFADRMERRRGGMRDGMPGRGSGI